MHTFPWIIAAGLLRLLPLCTASPIGGMVVNSNTLVRPPSLRTGPCSDPEASGPSAACWATLGMDNFLANWTTETVMPGAPLIGTIVCRPTENWAQCFIRFAYGHQNLGGAPMDSIYLYIKTLTSALLTLTGTPYTLQRIYNSASSSLFASSATLSSYDIYPIDTILLALLTLKQPSLQDKRFATYISAHPVPGYFTNSTTSTTPPTPSEAVIYHTLVDSLEARLTNVMGNWTLFQALLGDAEAWVEANYTSVAHYFHEWTNISPTAAGLLDALGGTGGLGLGKRAAGEGAASTT
ncbi:MAG: hypothetical protein Q9169_005956 [Polycauliona sp. 2 TL-2023]